LASALIENSAFLTHRKGMGLQIRQKLFSLGPIFAIDDQSPTGCLRTTTMAAHVEWDKGSTTALSW
jgi:hypothetical protein